VETPKATYTPTVIPSNAEGSVSLRKEYGFFDSGCACAQNDIINNAKEKKFSHI